METPSQEMIDTLYASYQWCAIIGSALLVILIVLSFIGVFEDFDASGDIGIFSLRGVLIFVASFGLCGMQAIDSGYSRISSVWIALASGAIVMVLLLLVLKLLLRLQANGTMSADDFVGSTGRVYLSIPAARAPGGRIIVQGKGCTREVSACADEAIASGTEVTVVAALTPSLFLVRPVY